MRQGLCRFVIVFTASVILMMNKFDLSCWKENIMHIICLAININLYRPCNARQIGRNKRTKREKKETKEAKEEELSRNKSRSEMIRKKAERKQKQRRSTVIIITNR